MKLIATRNYERAIRKLISDEARLDMEAAIAANPGAAPAIRGTGGIRKLRWAAPGRGKRGGVRAIYFWHVRPGTVYLLGAYAKSDRDDLRPADRKAWSRLAVEIEREGAGE